MKKRFFAMALTVVLLVGMMPGVLAALAGKTIQVFTGVDIYIDDVKLEPRDANGNPVEVFVYNGTTYLPVRAVGEAVGKTVQWDSKTSSVYLGKHAGEKPAVWLKDLDYFEGENWNISNTEKDNVGNTQTNVIYGDSMSNTYKLNGQYSMISGVLFQSHQYRSSNITHALRLYGDGELLYEAEMTKGIEPIDFSVDLRGVLELKVTFSCNSWYSHGEAAIADCGLWT